MRIFLRLAMSCVLCLALATTSLAQTPPKQKEQITRTQLAEALLYVAESTEYSTDDEVKSASGVIRILLGSLLTEQTRPMLNHLKPFAIEQLQRIDKMRELQQSR